MPVTVRPFHHYGISVPDLDAALDWYGRAFGLAEYARWTIGPPQTRIALAADPAGPLRVEFFEQAGSAPDPVRTAPGLASFAAHGLHHVAFAVDDMDAALAALAAMGAPGTRRRSGPGGYDFAFVTDPWGTPFELIAPDPWTPTP
ncbi:MAG: VOC family protein [Hasllibacter sp.]